MRIRQIAIDCLLVSFIAFSTLALAQAQSGVHIPFATCIRFECDSLTDTPTCMFIFGGSFPTCVFTDNSCFQLASTYTVCWCFDPVTNTIKNGAEIPRCQE